MRSGAVPRPWDIEGTMPPDPLDLWLVVLDTWMSPSNCVSWLRRLTAPTLLVSAHGQTALRVSAAIPYPVLVSPPTIAWDSLQELLDMLLDMTVGKVLLQEGTASYLIV